MSSHERLQRGVERLFFKGKSTKTSSYVAYVIGNIFLMLVLFYLLLNTFAYDWTGQLYPVGSGFNLSSLSGGLDNAIPLMPQWAIFYVYLFYPMVILTMLFFGFVAYKRGYALGWSLVFISAVAVLIYIAFPVSTYWWRAEYLAQPLTGNFWATEVYNIWASDTSFNCFPSLHAAVSISCAYAWLQFGKANSSYVAKIVAGISAVIAAGVILSTLFVKQHYIADEIGGIILALAVSIVVFRYFQRPKTENSKAP